jgi:hypothetical protein
MVPAGIKGSCGRDADVVGREPSTGADRFDRRSWALVVVGGNRDTRFSGRCKAEVTAEIEAEAEAEVEVEVQVEVEVVAGVLLDSGTGSSLWGFVGMVAGRGILDEADGLSENVIVVAVLVTGVGSFAWGYLRFLFIFRRLGSIRSTPSKSRPAIMSSSSGTRVFLGGRLGMAC